MYSKSKESVSGMDMWTTTASMVDVALGKPTNMTITHQRTYSAIDFGDTRVDVTKIYIFTNSGDYGDAIISLDNINADNINYNFSVKNGDGQVVASGNLSVKPISFKYNKGEKYFITYSPSDPMVFNIDIGDKTKAWAGPIININLTWNTTVKHYFILNQKTFTKGTKFKDVVKYFNR
jgi:hypothetical protein